MKKQRRKVGDIISIPLTDGRFAYGIVLEEPLFGFFDVEPSKEEAPPLERIITSPLLFRIDVQRYSITKGIWKVIGHIKPPAKFLEPPKFFIQSSMNGALFITTTGEDRVPATYEECAQLECCAAWDPEHVVTRLEDHFAGRPSKVVEILRPKRITT